MDSVGTLSSEDINADKIYATTFNQSFEACWTDVCTSASTRRCVLTEASVVYHEQLACHSYSIKALGASCPSFHRSNEPRTLSSYTVSLTEHLLCALSCYYTMGYAQWVTVRIINSFHNGNIKVQNAKVNW